MNDHLGYDAPTKKQLADAEAIIQRFAEIWSRPVADDLRVLMHEETRNLIPPMKEPGDREAVVEHFRGILTMLPDLKIKVIRWAPAGDAVMVEWRADATVQGKPISWTGVDRFNVRDGRMYEASVYWDTRGLAERFAALTGQSQ